MVTALSGCSASRQPYTTIQTIQSSQSAAAQCCSLPSGVSAAYNRLLGLVAIGHSGLTGYLSDADSYKALANSWATGTNPAVGSLYERLAAVEPTILGHVANGAIPGSRAVNLQAEALDAFALVPHPQLVVIQDVGNDIACDGSDAANYAVVAAEVRSALHDISSMSPRTTILVLGQLGTPMQKAIPANIARLATISDAYDAVFQAECSRVAHCVYDDSAKVKYSYRISELVPGDWNHLTITGQARLAQLIWPVAAKALGI
jgi:lysophospholipase L1-like esterase